MENSRSIDYDTIVLEFQKGKKSLASISVNKTDLDTLINAHGHTLSQVVGDMAQTIEDEIRKRSVETNNN